MRTAVSGVRSSCDASATSRRCAPTDSLECLEHLVEPRRQAAELVVAAHLDALGQVARRGDALGGGRQAPDRPERRGRDERREPCGERDADAADQEDPEPDPAERAVGRAASGCGDDDRAAAVDALARRPRAWTPLMCWSP